MNILMMTNTFTPHVGGVARSIEGFVERYRELGHHVKVVAPEFNDMPHHEPDVIRIPAIREFNHTDFSMALPVPHNLSQMVNRFEPDIIHSHHPFLIGSTALRIAHSHQLPLVFTHHTKYEDYTHNVPGDSEALKRFVKKLATNYANTCDRVFVPSESVAELVQERGVTAPVSVVPTGVDVKRFSKGDGHAFRVKMGIPDNAFVIGHLGRLSQEKNLPFLTETIIAFLQTAPAELNACCLIAGDGPLASTIQKMFEEQGLSENLYRCGVIDRDSVQDAYHAMNVFAFASQTETQGMVLTEAMASGVPVVAVDASGVREVVRDEINGRILDTLDRESFASALNWISSKSSSEYQELKCNALSTAADFSMEKTANTALELYSRLRNYNTAHRHPDYPIWIDALNVFESEWLILKNTLSAAADSVTES